MQTTDAPAFSGREDLIQRLGSISEARDLYTLPGAAKPGLSLRDDAAIIIPFMACWPSQRSDKNTHIVSMNLFSQKINESYISTLIEFLQIFWYNPFFNTVGANKSPVHSEQEWVKVVCGLKFYAPIAALFPRYMT